MGTLIKNRPPQRPLKEAKQKRHSYALQKKLDADRVELLSL
jgi:hypothetical protein